MILQSKLSKTTHQMADPDIWLTGDYKGVDPVFLGRLAFYAKYCFEKGLTKIKQMKVNTGIRTDAFQAILYEEAKTYKKTKKLGKYKVKNAAKPGTSYHGETVRLAVDVDKSHPFYKATNEELAPFGLCKPLLCNGEVWHGQPIETAKLGADASAPKVRALVPVDLVPQFKAKFNLTDPEVSYLAAYKYPADLAVGLLAGKKDFSAETMKYLYSYKHWESLREKLGI